MNFSKMISKFPAVFNFNRLFFTLNRFICNLLPVLADHSRAPSSVLVSLSHFLFETEGH